MSWIFDGERPMAWPHAGAKLAEKFIRNADALGDAFGYRRAFGKLRRACCFARRFRLGRGGAIRRDRWAKWRGQDDLVQGDLGSGPGRIWYDYLRGAEPARHSLA